MGEARELTGPNLSEGIPRGELVEGGSLLGHYDGEAVMLVLDAGEVLAVSATCTHYGGPLAEGLVVGGTVRCPWHHACFDLRTGDSGPPALNALARYATAESDGRVRVTGRLEAEPQSLTERKNLPERIVIVGAGAAGNIAAERLRLLGYQREIILLGSEPNVPTDRPNLSKDYLAGNAPEEWLPLRDEAFYADLDVRFEMGRTAIGLDVERRVLTLDDGTTLDYEALLLATGARARRLPVPGADADHVYTLRTLADTRALIERAQPGARAVVVGASFIGLEVAASLRQRGVEVAVVAPEAQPLAAILGEEVGAWIRSLHESHGVELHLGRSLGRIDAGAVVLDDAAELPADFVVLGVGVKPAVELAEAAGLTVDNGIVVDAQLRTSAPGVFAAGDVARYPDARSGELVRIEHWCVAEQMGTTAARNLLGRSEPFTAVPFFWSQHYDQTIAYVGHAARWDRIDRAGRLADGDCALAYRRGGQTLAVATVGRDQVSLRAEVALAEGDEATLAELIPPAG